MKINTIFNSVIIGATIARYLSNQVPTWEIALLDRSLIGTGATNYSAGLHIPYGISPEIQKLSRDSENEYNLFKRSANLPIYNVPIIGIVSKENYNKQCSYFNHKPTELILEKDALPDTIGQINLSSEEIVFQVAGCHYADVYALNSHIVKTLRVNSKVKIWEGTNITNIADNGDLVSLTLQDDRIIHSKSIILAPGPWVKDRAFAPILTPFNIRTKKIIALHIDRIPTPHDPVLFFFDHDAFLLPLYERGHWLFSFTCTEWDVVPSSLLDITAEDRNNALKILKQYCPELIRDCISGRVFCDAYSQNGAPIIAKVPSNPKIIFAGAASGSGYRLAPGIANKAASLVLSK